MLPLILVAAAAAIFVAYTFWDEIKKYLNDAMERVKKIINSAIVGFSVFVESGSISSGIKAAYKFYSKNTKGQWQETVVTKTVTDEEIPEHIRRRLEASSGPVDISNELELELS